MFLNYYFKRIINDKIKLIIILFVSVVMILDLILRIKYFPIGSTPMQANFNTFLSLTGNDMFFHALIFWFLPIYLSILSAEDVIEDYNTGCINALIVRKGKKTYLLNNFLKAFIISFSTIFLALFFNLVLSFIIFNGATYSPFSNFASNLEQSHLLVKSLQNPFFTNIAFILITSILSGVVGMASVGFALGFKERKIVYPLSFVIWFIPFCFHKSIMLSIQPFSEYDLKQILPTYLFTLILHLLVPIIIYKKETIYHEKI